MLSSRDRLLWGIFGIALTVVGLELLARSGVAGAPENLPMPSRLGGELVSLFSDGEFRSDVLFTVSTWFAGLAIASVVGIVAGLILGSAPGIERATTLLIELMRPLPSVAIGPLLVLFLGSGLETNALTVAYASVWPILFNVLYATRSVDPVRLQTARVLGWSRLKTAWRVRIPSTAPFALTGIRIAASIGLIVTVSVELLIGGNKGIGGFILRTSSAGANLQATYAATFVGGVLGLLASMGLQAIHDRRYAWSKEVADV